MLSVLLTACFGFVSCSDDDDVSPQGTGGDSPTDVAVSGDVSSVEVREATIEGFVNALDIQSFTLPVWKARLFGLKSNAFRAEKHTSPSRKAMLSKINLK